MNQSQTEHKYDVIIIGAGPAGLTAGDILVAAGKKVLVLEASASYVGGISRTEEYKGYRFDIGGHRFFSKSKEVNEYWQGALPNDFISRPRLSRIFYGGKFYNYPLSAVQALLNLGIVRSTLCVLSYLKWQIFPVRQPANFRDWVSNQFGRRLFEIFFKTYTEKVWGMKCEEISADWAAQRIKNLNLFNAVTSSLLKSVQKFTKSSAKQSPQIKTLIDSFQYPRLGPGMMWEAVRDRFLCNGGHVRMGQTVTALRLEAGLWSVSGADAVVIAHADHVISSAPLREMMAGIEPPPRSRVFADKLRYRDFLTVALILDNPVPFKDNWIYIHDPAVKVGRIQNFRSWSPELLPNTTSSCLGLEYFCFEGDGLWTMSDADLIALATRELIQLGLSSGGQVLDGKVVRQPKAYPVYDDEYKANLEQIRADLAANYPGFHPIGRNGMHRYNNQDHSMMTAMLTARNILAGEPQYDIWHVNEDAEYHEEGRHGEAQALNSLRAVPSRLSQHE